MTRTSTIRTIDEKQGGSGRLVFVTVAQEISGEAGVAIREEQNIVYRGVEGRGGEAGAGRTAAAGGRAVGTLRPDPVLLFRYSALTGNGHRIHYDLDYVTRVEGYPGLVVHGPLQATLLAALAQPGGRRCAAAPLRLSRAAGRRSTIAS